MFNPRGAIVRSMRLADSHTNADGSETKVVLSGAGIIVRVRAVAESRRTFRRFCERHGLVASAIENNAHCDGTFNRRTGERIRDSEVAPTAFQVIGDGPALLALTTHACLESWSYALAIRVPVISGGNGEAKPRPSSGSAFGRPSTLKSTATALATETANRVRSYQTNAS